MAILAKYWPYWLIWCHVGCGARATPTIECVPTSELVVQYDKDFNNQTKKLADRMGGWMDISMIHRSPDSDKNTGTIYFSARSETDRNRHGRWPPTTRTCNSCLSVIIIPDLEL